MQQLTPIHVACSCNVWPDPDLQNSYNVSMLLTSNYIVIKLLCLMQEINSKVDT